jgi:glutamine synthetase
MLLAPDLDTSLVYPWGDDDNRICRLICDIYSPGGEPFAGDPRGTLKTVLAKAKSMGYTMNAGMEAEFFLFKPDEAGQATTTTHDVGGYLTSLPPTSANACPARHGVYARAHGPRSRRRIRSRPRPAREIDFGTPTLKTADNIATFRFVVKHVATKFGLLASFMPKPIFGQNGSGMHTHQSLFKGKENAFWDPKAEWELSKTALHYIGGMLRHARGMCAITNPLVNSYKRLVPGYEAPVNVAWSMRNRSPLIQFRIGADSARVSSSVTGSVSQSVSGARGHARRGARRDRDERGLSRTGE